MGTRVYVNSISRVRIPPCPPGIAVCRVSTDGVFCIKNAITTPTTTLVPNKINNAEKCRSL